MVSKKVYLKAALFVILVFLAGLHLLIFFLVSIVGSLMTGSYLLFLGGLFFFLIFIVLMFIARKLEPAWDEVQARLGFKPKPKSTKEALKESLPLFAILAVTFAIALILEWYFNEFPSSVNKELAREMLRSLMTIDGILLGFYGVILAHLLWAIHSKGNLIYELLISERVDRDVSAHLNEELNRLGRTRLGAVLSMFYALAPTLASFLLCLTKLPLTEGSGTIAVRSAMFDPVLAMITGIVLLVYMLLMNDLLPRKGKWPTEATPAP